MKEYPDNKSDGPLQISYVAIHGSGGFKKKVNYKKPKTTGVGK